jgi:uncharacterized protein YutE (UPF0331/DUF86 family)
MVTSTANLERKRLLTLAEEYRNKGYEVLLHPNPEELPDFLRSYRPDMIVCRGEEAVVIEVKSRSSLSSSATQYLRSLAQVVEQHPGWRFELVVANPDDIAYSPKAEGSFQEDEIKARLQVARQLAEQHPESAILYSWALVEATLRLLAEKEELSLQRVDPAYLVKQLTTEGVISRSEYQLLMDALSLRNAVAHGFKTKQITQSFVCELIESAEQLLKALNSGESG